MQKNRARWMSVFITSGTLGIALSPAFYSTFVGIFGFRRILWTALPGILISIALLIWVRPPGDVPRRSRSFDWTPFRAVWRPMTILYFGVFFRSAVQVTYAQFLALYLYRERGYTLTAAAWALTLYLTAGAIGGFAGGYIADRFGARRVILLSFALSVPFMVRSSARSGRTDSAFHHPGKRRGRAGPGAHSGGDRVGVSDGICVGRRRVDFHPVDGLGRAAHVPAHGSLRAAGIPAPRLVAGPLLAA
jgi:MFS family permease